MKNNKCNRTMLTEGKIGLDKMCRANGCERRIGGWRSK
jgi:hypothetical protein